MGPVDKGYDIAKSEPWSEIRRWSNEAVARRVTESVMRKLKRGLREQRDASDDLIEFDDAEEALDFIKEHIDGYEELSINSDALYFGLGDVYTWDDMAREFMGSPEARNANIVRGKNDAFLHLGNDATLLAYLRWLQNKDGYLCFITNPDEDGNPRPLENYI
ncbi:MAG: hypothetical protein LUD72_13605 [Bacteroidales bacterium]|nr:hypothetical protein [Bacteroidales bacterium]